MDSFERKVRKEMAELRVQLKKMVLVRRNLLEEIKKRAEWEGMLYGDGVSEPDAGCNLCKGDPHDHDDDCPINEINDLLKGRQIMDDL
jgi:hypothetical protein